jgi:hypothetical protein
MAIKLIAGYSKKAGLPGYSSHQFSVSIETELSDPRMVAQKSARLYDALQKCVDQQIQKPGFVPPDGYGLHQNGAGNCSDKQRHLIRRIATEKGLDYERTDQLAIEIFGAKVAELSKAQASELIEQLLAGNGNRRSPRDGATEQGAST